MTLPELIAKLSEARRSNTTLDRAIDAAIRPGVDPMPCRYYTHQMDHAVLVVPPDHDWSLYSDGVAGCEPSDPDGCPTAGSHGATPAIALCIAALTARMILQGAGT